MRQLRVGIVGCGEVSQITHLLTLAQLYDQFVVSALCDVNETALQYDTPYARNLPIRLQVTETNGRGGVSERAELPAWGDAFVGEWQAFHASVTQAGPAPKTSPADCRHDLALLADMIELRRR